jgi:hypothetical protein
MHNLTVYSVGDRVRFRPNGNLGVVVMTGPAPDVVWVRWSPSRTNPDSRVSPLSYNISCLEHMLSFTTYRSTLTMIDDSFRDDIDFSY